MVVLGDTIAVPGIRRTDPNDTFTMVWAVESHLDAVAGEGVIWQINVNDVPVDSGFVGVRSLSQPNFSDFPSRMPNARSGMAAVEGYAKTLRMGDYAGGVITVQAVAFAHNGVDVKLMSPTWILNDSDGTDRRPSNKTIHWRASTGNNSNDGLSSGAAVKDLHKAIELACVSNNCGGATIIMHESHAGGGGLVSPGVLSSPGAWHTGPLHFLTIQCQPGVTWSRTAPPIGTFPDDRISCTGTGPNTYCRVRVTGYDVVGGGPIFSPAINGTTGAPEVIVQLWREGGTHRSAYYDSSVNALCAVDDCECFAIDPHLSASSSIHASYCTGELRKGARIAYSAETLLFDCFVQGTLGGGVYIQGPIQNSVAHSVVCTEHTYRRNVTRGWACNQADGFLPLDDLEVVQTGSTMRVLGPAGSTNAFGAHAAELIGAPAVSGAVTGILISGHPVSANNGVFAVLGAGVSSTRQYVDLDNPSGVTSASTAGVLLETHLRGLPYNQLVHTSYISFGTSRTGQDVFRDIANFALEDETQGAFDNFANHDKLLIDNCRGAGGFSNISMGVGAMTNSIVRRCSWTGSTFLANGPQSWSGTQVTNIVVNSMGSGVAAAIAAGMEMSYCHAIDGSTPVGATNHSTGSWLENDPTESPYDMSPSAGNFATGHPLMPNTASWAFSPTRSTKGCTKQIAQLDWLLATDDIEGAGAVTIGVVAAAEGFVGLEAAGAATIGVTSAATGYVGVGGAGAVSVGVTASGAGFLGAEAPSLALPQDAIAVESVRAVPVSPSDTLNFTEPVLGVRVSTAGSVSIRMIDGTDIVVPLPAGGELPLRAVRVNLTGTTASGIYALT